MLRPMPAAAMAVLWLMTLVPSIVSGPWLAMPPPPLALLPMIVTLCR
jgi:hypothetical protein